MSADDGWIVVYEDILDIMSDFWWIISEYNKVFRLDIFIFWD